MKMMLNILREKKWLNRILAVKIKSRKNNPHSALDIFTDNKWLL